MNKTKGIVLTGNYVVSKILKKSKARYAKGVRVGDEMKFVLELAKTSWLKNSRDV